MLLPVIALSMGMQRVGDADQGPPTEKDPNDTVRIVSAVPALTRRLLRWAGRIDPVTACVVTATAIFALAGIGTPLLGLKVFADPGLLAQYSATAMSWPAWRSRPRTSGTWSMSYCPPPSWSASR